MVAVKENKTFIDRWKLQTKWKLLWSWACKSLRELSLNFNKKEDTCTKLQKVKVRIHNTQSRSILSKGFRSMLYMTEKVKRTVNVIDVIICPFNVILTIQLKVSKPLW